MRAAVLYSTVPAGTGYAEARPLLIQELDRPEPRPGELGVEITYSSLCHSDLSVVDGSRVRPLPMALGHEAVGRVVAVGDGVHDVSEGDHVVLVFVPSCGNCRACLAGRPALCHRAAEVNGSGDLLHGEALLRTPSGERINHHLGVSAFADYAVVARESVVVIGDDVPDTVAAMFGCAVLTGMGAVLNTAAVTTGQSVAVFGLGAVGLSAVMAASLAGAAAVIAIDPNAGKHQLARECGATAVGTPDDAARLVAEATGDGVDVAVEAVGSAGVIASCLDLVTRGGAVVSVGLPKPVGGTDGRGTAVRGRREEAARFLHGGCRAGAGHPAVPGPLAGRAAPGRAAAHGHQAAGGNQRRPRCAGRRRSGAQAVPGLVAGF